MQCWQFFFGAWAMAVTWLVTAGPAPAQPQEGTPWTAPPQFSLIEHWPAADHGAEYVDEEALLFAPQPEPSWDRRPGNDFSGPPGQDRSPLKVRTLWAPAQNVRGQGSKVSMTGLQASLAVPLYIEPTGRSIWIAMTNLEHLELGGNAILPDSLTPLPTDLWKITVGVLHSREFDNGWRGGLMLNVGAASDEPFAGIRDMTLTTLGFLTVPAGPRDAWSFSLFYSPTSQLPFPIPGIAYVWRPGEQFSANIGIPFSLRYQPTETFCFTASYLPLTNVTLRASQQLATYWNLYAGYQITNETYWLSDRVNSHDRLYLFDQRAAIGLERDLPFGFSVDLSAAYVFDRRIFQAESFSGDRRDVIAIDAGPAVSLLLRWSR